MKQDWDYKKLDEVGNINYGTRVVQKKDKGSSYYVYGGGGATFMVDSYNREDCFIVSRFALSPKCTRYVKGRFFLNDSGLSVSTKTTYLTQSFLDKALLANNDVIYSMGKGLAQRNLDITSFKHLLIPIPPIDEQNTICSLLDNLNLVIEKKKQQIEELDNLAQSLFYDMFGDPLSNEKGWEIRKYGKEFKIGAGGTPSKSVSEYWENGTIPWIGSNMCQNRIIYQTDGKYITQEGLTHSSAKMLEKGTVIVALVGATIGKVGLLETETSTNQNVAYINVNENPSFNSYFVYYQLQKLYELFMAIGNGDFKMANQGFIKDLPIITPPLPLQQAFAEKVKAIERQKELINQSIKDVQTLFDAKMDYYFGD